MHLRLPDRVILICNLVVALAHSEPGRTKLSEVRALRDLSLAMYVFLQRLIDVNHSDPGNIVVRPFHISSCSMLTSSLLSIFFLLLSFDGLYLFNRLLTQLYTSFKVTRVIFDRSIWSTKSKQN